MSISFKYSKFVLTLFTSLVMCLIFVSPTKAATTCGDILAPETWDSAGSPYNITCDIQVKNTVSLRIKEGVTVRVASTSRILIEPGASLKIEGNLSNKVIFEPETALIESGSVKPATWKGIEIQGGSNPGDNSSSINYAVFRYGGKSWQGAYHGTGVWTGVLFANNSSPQIANTLFEDNHMGIYSSGAGRPTINSCAFNRNIYAPISFMPGAKPQIENVTYGSGADANGFNVLGLGPIMYGGHPFFSAGQMAASDIIFQENGINGFPNIPYALMGPVNVPAGISLTINPGILIKMGPNNPRPITGPGYTVDYPATTFDPHQYSLIKVHEGGALLINGANQGNDSVVFTSMYDDTNYHSRPYGGDINLDGSTTKPAPCDWISLHIGGAANINYSQFRYGAGAERWGMVFDAYFHWVIYAGSNSSVEIKNSIFEDNIVGVHSNATVNRTKITSSVFNRNIYTPITFMPGIAGNNTLDLSDITFGSGADANGFNALGIGPVCSARHPWVGPRQVSTNGVIKQENGINGFPNIPYLGVSDIQVLNGIALTIGPGILIKVWPTNPRPISGPGYTLDLGVPVWSGQWIINGGGNLIIQGADQGDGSVVFTSTYDDTVYHSRPYGGDTNLDGSATIPAPDHRGWDNIHIEGGANINYAKFRYSHGYERWGGIFDLTTHFTVFTGSNSSTTIANSIFEDNIVGFHSHSNGTNRPVISSSVFNRNAGIPITFMPEGKPLLSNITFGSGAAANAFNALGIVNLITGEFWVGPRNMQANATITPENGINGFPNLPYIMGGRLGIPAGRTLTIEPGVIIKMGAINPRPITVASGVVIDLGYNAYDRWEIRGKLQMNGADCNSVVCTSIYDDIGGDTNFDGNSTGPDAGQYNGFYLFDNSVLNASYAEFLYGNESIRIDSPNSTSSVSLLRTTFKNNNKGIYISNSNAKHKLSLSETNFTGNKVYAIDNRTTSWVNAQNLWWNDPSGPTHPANPGGIGDPVSDYVAFGNDYAKESFVLCAPLDKSPDKPYDLDSIVSGPCAPVPMVDLTWTYNEQTGSPQKGYRVELDTNGTFANPLWKSCDPALYCVEEGTITPETFTIWVPTAGIISYGNTYYWRVKVFDQEMEESVWSDTQSFQTPPRPGPQIDRDYSPEKPLVNQSVNFTDTSICYDAFGGYDCISRASPAGGVTYCWDFDWHLEDVGCDSTNAATSFSYAKPGNYSVLQKVTDENGIMCDDIFNVKVEVFLPRWREVAPW